MNLVIGNLLILALVAAELLVMHYSRKETIPWKAILSNIHSGHILLWVFRSLSLAAYLLILQQFSFRIADGLAPVVVWGLSFLAWDFCYYWSHRVHHEINALWAVHVVHHDGEHFNLSLGLRNSWYSNLTSFPFFIVFPLSGIPLEVFITVSGVHYFIQFLNHAHLIGKLGWLEYIFITPSHHRVHHGRNSIYVNRNYGGTFVIWDKIFNTFQPEKKDVPVDFGINNPDESANPLVINSRPIFGKWNLTRPLFRIRFETVFRYPPVYPVTGSLLIFGLLLCYIYMENSIPGFERSILFLIIFTGTLGIGGILEGKLWGLPVWLFSSIGLSCTYLWFFDIRLPVFLALIILMMIHSVLMTVISFRKMIPKDNELKV